jgi:iron(III) transport system substrate-binding protein
MSNGPKLLLGLLPLLTLLAIPFLLRPKHGVVTGDPVVVVTPHNETVRSEFGQAFARHMWDTARRRVHVDWRSPGGTSEISRYLASEFTAAFRTHWTARLGRRWNDEIAFAFSNPAVDREATDPEQRRAREDFLTSQVGIGIDVMFGGGSVEFAIQAEAGRLVDAGILRAHSEWFGPRGIPEQRGGERYWDADGRWIGACLSAFMICFNRDVLDRLKIETPPAAWADLAQPVYFEQLALADPSKSGSAAKMFEMLVQEQMARRYQEAGEQAGVPEGWDRAMRLIRRIGANARYFGDSASRVPIDVSLGLSAAGTAIDSYGRVQAEASRSPSGQARMDCAAPAGGSTVTADPIGLLRGAPHRELAVQFIEFVLSPAGQKLWSFKLGVPFGPQRTALRRLPILPELYSPEYAQYRSDPEEQPYAADRALVYRGEWTAKLFRTLSFIIKTMCVDTHDDLAEAHRALIESGFPPRATALFDDVTEVNYQSASTVIAPTLGSADLLDDALLTNRLIDRFGGQYRRVAQLARAGL